MPGARTPPVQRVAPQLRRPGRVPGPGEREDRLPADAGHHLGRRVGLLRRDLAVPPRPAEQAVPNRPRPRRPGRPARQAQAPLGRDEPAPGPGRCDERVHLHGRRTAGRRAGRPVRLRRHGALVRRTGPGGPAARAAAGRTTGRGCGRDRQEDGGVGAQGNRARRRTLADGGRRVRARRRGEAGGGGPPCLDPPRGAAGRQHRGGAGGPRRHRDGPHARGCVLRRAPPLAPRHRLGQPGVPGRQSSPSTARRGRRLASRPTTR